MNSTAKFEATDPARRKSTHCQHPKPAATPTNVQARCGLVRAREQKPRARNTPVNTNCSTSAVRFDDAPVAAVDGCGFVFGDPTGLLLGEFMGSYYFVFVYVLTGWISLVAILF
ncbi:MAG TPA: hypothetical protein VNN22_05670 [Verrucomicrobiae bacterium]|nr:hypothetical protein [Verrucomicrobiae bacterium]